MRTLKPGARVRLSWQDPDWEKPSIFEVSLVARPNGSVILVFQHGGIPEKAKQVQLRSRWKEVCRDLKNPENYATLC